MSNDLDERYLTHLSNNLNKGIYNHSGGHKKLGVINLCYLLL